VGATTWHGGAAFDLKFLPGLFLKGLKVLEGQGYVFAPKGSICGSVRQHDMVLLDRSGRPLIPALSWQCDKATQEVALLRQSGVESIVGRLETRFVLAKLLWAVNQRGDLFDSVHRVMMTGDLVALKLTGKARLGSSDALSNGLLDQHTRAFALKALTKTNIPSNWFPSVVQSADVVGVVREEEDSEWEEVISRLKDWKVVASLGDNHAGGVGCGLVDRNTFVVSLGTSGTVVRRADSLLPVQGEVAQFEYYGDRLILAMLANCGAWWGEFVKTHGDGKGDQELDGLADNAAGCIVPLESEASCKNRNFTMLSLGEKAASVQLALAGSLMDRLRDILSAVGDSEHTISKVVLTGGLSRSPLIRRTFKKWIQELDIDDVFVSALEGPAADQAAARGALMNALVGSGAYPDLSAAAMAFCPLKKLE